MSKPAKGTETFGQVRASSLVHPNLQGECFEEIHRLARQSRDLIPILTLQTNRTPIHDSRAFLRAEIY